VRAVAAGSAGADVWTEIAWLAVAAAADEPVLRHVVADARLMEAAPDRIVAAVLARRLAGGDTELAAALRALFLEILEAAPHLLREIENDLLTVVRRERQPVPIDDGAARNAPDQIEYASSPHAVGPEPEQRRGHRGGDQS